MGAKDGQEHESLMCGVQCEKEQILQCLYQDFANAPESELPPWMVDSHRDCHVQSCFHNCKVLDMVNQTAAMGEYILSEFQALEKIIDSCNIGDDQQWKKWLPTRGCYLADDGQELKMY